MTKGLSKRFGDSLKEASKLTVANARVEQELVELFPLIKSKGLRLELSYEDSLVGKVTIDGDVDMKSALAAFSEEEDLSLLRLHASPRGLVLPFSR